jgi:hypothetical protein
MMLHCWSLMLAALYGDFRLAGRGCTLLAVLAAAAAAVDVDELLSCDIHHWDVQLELAGSKLQVV